MVEGQFELSDDLRLKIEARAASQWADYKATCTEEQKQRGAEKLERFRTDENYRDERMQKMNELWAEADANKDKLLNRDEYKKFKSLMMEEAEQQGDWMDTNDHTESDYELIKHVQNNEKGITMDDMMRIMGIWMAKFEELKQQDETSAGGQSVSISNSDQNQSSAAAASSQQEE